MEKHNKMEKRKRKLKKAARRSKSLSPLLSPETRQNFAIKRKKAELLSSRPNFAPESAAIPAQTLSSKPCFSFIYLTKRDEFNFSYFKHDKTSEDKAKAALIDKMLFLSAYSWKEIMGMDKKHGYERIPSDELKFNPYEETPFKSQEKCMVFRFNEERYRLIGFKKFGNPTFYIVGFDFDYEAYNHGN